MAPLFCMKKTEELSESPSPHNKPTPIHTHTQTQQHSSTMASSSFVAFLVVAFMLVPAMSHPVVPGSGTRRNQTLHKLRRIRVHLKKINKPPLKTIQSPDGDVIDCVLSHLQPAFDHPKLKGHKPLDPPDRPKTNGSSEVKEENMQTWRDSGEWCPEGSVPIRRSTEEDVMRGSSITRFGRRRETSGGVHEHAVVFVKGGQYYGARASLNVWPPRVTDKSEFSLSQIWVISGSFGHDLNTIEAGWQVSPELYGDNHPRFFTYWTTDAYKGTGCYNLLCSGFVQTNNKIAIGGAISPMSSFNGNQFDIGLMIWKDPKHGHWWLELGNGQLVGYWPGFLFTHLQNHARMIQFGGEIVNGRSSSSFHTSTQMGSGHFAEEGFRKAAYFRNLQVVDWDNNLIPPSNLHLLADNSNCYDIRQGTNNIWGTYFYYGGPGRNVKCP